MAILLVRSVHPAVDRPVVGNTTEVVAPVGVDMAALAAVLVPSVDKAVVQGLRMVVPSDLVG